MAKPFTLNEMLIIAAAREINDGENIILGVGLPMTAGALAKALHAPNATLMLESGIVDFEPLVPLNHIADAHAMRGYSYNTDLFSIFTALYRGFVDVCFLGVGQVDRYGNLNTTTIGDYYKPDLRLPGSGGAADFISYSKRTVLTMRSGEFKEKLDYLTSPGHLRGGNSRNESGYFPKDSGPCALITTQGIFHFDEETKEMFLARIHPGVEVEEIQAKVPWEMKVAEDLKVTERPSDEEIAFVRRFAPNQTMSRALGIELGIEHAVAQIKKMRAEN
ncbi:CoA-transferase subunit beta [Desulfatibacillum aliphaticivorans]|uniref:CoA-transferase subunit beta n=1 Tax=Desulfatibacillum aliphaticivorans TaxID=218208 RepID=UPI0004201500|nr:CoA-transferase [Desulfatibacillum aliphaticivorans]